MNKVLSVLIKRLTQIKQVNEVLIEHGGEQYIKLSSLYSNQVDPLIFIPYNEYPILLKLRKLNHLQIEACGKFSLIETFDDQIRNARGKMSIAKMVEYSELQHKILKAAMVHPTYEEFMAQSEEDSLRVEAEKEIDELEELICSMDESPKKKRLRTELNTLIMQTRFYLPADFISHILSYALSMNDTDIKLVTDEILLNAAIKAEKGNDNPSDHVHGNLDYFNLEDINERGWASLHNHRKKD